MAGFVKDQLIGPQGVSRMLTADENFNFTQNYLEDELKDVFFKTSGCSKVEFLFIIS